MAFVDYSLASPGASLERKQLPFYFNVHQSVGLGRTNRKDDVVLVQLLLTTLIEDPACPFHLKPLRIDGIFGKRTHAALMAMLTQTSAGRTYFKDPDGIVNRAFGNVAERELAGKGFYTIVYLNKLYAMYNWTDYSKQLVMTAVRNVISDLKSAI